MRKFKLQANFCPSTEMARHLLKEGRSGVGLGIRVEMNLFLTVTVWFTA